MELLEQFTKGDLEAFETLFRQFQSEVYGWIIRIVRDPGTAEDLTVEAFWRAYRARAQFDPARSFAAWMRRIATNAAFDHLKKARREVPLLEVHAARRPVGSIPDPAVRSEVHAKIESAFLQLPAKLRIVATLTLVEERGYEEAAEALGISLGAVKSRMFRAVRILRKKLIRSGIQP
jgi:RNA polymerase sigma-70 factor, ECF subfamily